MAKNLSVEDAKQIFIEAIKESDKYIEYRKQLELVNEQPELKRQIDDFRARNYELQKSDDIDFGKLTRFQNEFKVFRENPLVDNFLAAELDFCKMMQDLNFDITEAMDFE